MDTDTLRRDFPLLNNDNSVVYFDNACATLKPLAVLEAMDDYNRNFPTCGGRSVHYLAEKVTQSVQSARESVASFINAKSTDEVVFVRNTSEGINLLARTLPLEAGDVILTSDKEHNSNLVPWQLAAERTGAIHKVVRTHDDGTFDLEALKTALQAGGVKVLALGWVSNLDGVAIPVSEVIELAKEYAVTVVLDAAQAAPHTSIDVQALGVDFLIFSGHKLCGPSGTGVVYGRYDKFSELAPFMVGGSTVSNTTYDSYELLPLPERFEAGTQDYAGIIGLKAAVDYIQNVGVDNIARHQHKLNAYATERLEAFTGLQILGPLDPALRGGILSFTVEGLDMHQIALLLDSGSRVAVRSGQHCVHSWFNEKGIVGSVRLSFYLYNTLEEVDKFIDGLEKVYAVYK